MLRRRALAQPPLFAPGELEALSALIGRRQTKLQSTALKGAARLYRRKPKKLMRRMALA